MKHALIALALALVFGACSSGYGTPHPVDAGIDGPSTQKDFTAFGFATPAVIGAIDSASRTISLTVPFGTDVSALVASFSTTGTVVKVGATTQVSGVTSNDFHTPVTYTVGAADDSMQVYTVSVAVAQSSAKAITAFAFASPAATGVIDEAAKTIAITVPSGTPTAGLVASFTTMAKRVLVGGAVQTSGVTANDFTLPLAYTAEAFDGTMATYTVTVTVAPSTAKAITSFAFTTQAAAGAITGTTIALTVPFGTSRAALVATFATTGAHVRVNGVDQISGTTANDFSAPLTYVVVAGDGSIASYVVTVAVALDSARSITSFAFTTPAATGTIDQTAKTIAVAVPFGTDVSALVATFAMTGASVKVNGTTQTSGITPNTFGTPVTYVVTASDGSTASYVVTVTIAQNPAKAITAFSFANPPTTGFIDETAKTITLTVPFATNVTALVATFATTGANVRVGGTTQASGTTPNSFATPVTYVVTAADGSTASYVATVTVAANAAKAITAFSFATPAATGTIDEVGKTIAISVPYQTVVTALVATFATTGASVKVGGVVQTSGATANNFTSSVSYLVTASDSTTASYTVNVTVRPPLMTATGGVVTVDGDFEVHTFKASSTFQITSGSGPIESLVIAGGGGGGNYAGGGGGAGGVVHTSPGATYSVGQSLSITVGAGGPGRGNGGSSIFDSIVATGGGGGGDASGGYLGASGGSGGGGGPAGFSSPTPGIGGNGLLGQGSNGGHGLNNAANEGGGGGGCGGGSLDAVEGVRGGNGGAGCAFAISGALMTYASGGSGGADGKPSGAVSPGGGGAGGGSNAAAGTDGSANTGGGGGGAGLSVGTEGAGGSGIVILRFKYR